MYVLTIYVCLLVLLFPMTFSLNFLKNKGSTIADLKGEIVSLSRSVKRGLEATEEDRNQILTIFEQLEKKQKNKKTLKMRELNAVWSLEYTTSDSILGKGSPGKRIGPIKQTIDAINLKAENSEVVEYLGFLRVPSKVTADLSPLSPSKVAVQFKKFSLGPINFKAPESFKGELDVTYLDSDLRLSRGDKGNIFVLTKLSDLK